jgi:hypothetical protein
MTSQRWSKLISVLVFGLVLATADSAQAQWGFPGTWGYPAVSQFGLGYGVFRESRLSATVHSEREVTWAQATSSASRCPAMPRASANCRSRPRRFHRCPKP